MFMSLLSQLDNQGNAISAEAFVAPLPLDLFSIFSPSLLGNLFPPLFHFSLPTFSISDYASQNLLDWLERPRPWRCVTLTTQQQSPCGTVTCLSYSTEINWVFSPLDEGEEERRGQKWNPSKTKWLLYEQQIDICFVLELLSNNYYNFSEIIVFVIILGSLSARKHFSINRNTCDRTREILL